MIKKILKITLPLLLAIVLFWFAYKDLDFEKLKLDLQHANYLMVFLAFIPTLISHFSRARRWQLMLQSSGQSPTFLQTFVAVMGGYFANYLLPRMGEVTRCGMLFQSGKIPVQTSLGTVLAERALDLLALLAITALAFGIEFQLLSEFFGDLLAQKQKAGASNSGTSIFTYILMLGGIAGAVGLYLLYRLRHIPAFGVIWNFIAGLFKAMFSILKIKNKLEFSLHTLLIWLGYFMSTYLGFFMLDATSNLGLVAALMIFVVGSYGMVAPVQGGIGAFHFMVKSGLVLYAIESQTAYTVALLMHTSQTIFNMTIGGVCVAVNFYLTKNNKADAG
jgi:uncharacterized membrane protein YbhN (UPF0104 family)